MTLARAAPAAHPMAASLVARLRREDDLHPDPIRAVCVACVMSVALAWPVLSPSGSFHGRLDLALAFLAMHAFVLSWPIGACLSHYRAHRDVLHPAFVAALSFVVFHVALNPIIVGDPSILEWRDLDVLPAETLFVRVAASYGVLLLAWAALWAGMRVRFSFREAMARLTSGGGRTWLFAAVGLSFIAIGVIGNVGAVGGIGTYLRKVPRFYEVPEDIADRLNYGGTKWVLMARFLPVGCLILGIGTAIRQRLAARRAALVLLASSLPCIPLNCYNGGRGNMFQAAFFAFIAYAAVYRPIRFATLARYGTVVFAIIHILGYLRGAAANGLMDQVDIVQAFAAYPLIIRSFALYLSNYLGTLHLTSEVLTRGVAWGQTAFAGVTGMFGGAQPLTTQIEMWRRLGLEEGSNPRYGAPGELFFNFGPAGVIVGMFAIGIALRLLAHAYDGGKRSRTVAGALCAVFAASVANFLVIGNLSYIPPFFTYFAAPFYLGIAATRGQRC